MDGEFVSQVLDFAHLEHPPGINCLMYQLVERQVRSSVDAVINGCVASSRFRFDLCVVSF